jgi:hypothetical protein
MPLAGYFDDSGKIHDRPSLVIGGFVGGSDTWKQLHERWQPLLSKHGLSYYRGAECEHGNGEFDRTKNPKWQDPKARSDCRMEFVKAILDSHLNGFVAGLVSEDYKQLSRSEKARIGKPFSGSEQESDKFLGGMQFRPTSRIG